MVKGGERMAEVLKGINEIAWGMPLVILVVGAGIYFSIRMKFPQFRYMKEMVRIMGSGRDSEHGLSPLKTFIFTAARSVGVGNIAGMAAAHRLNLDAFQPAVASAHVVCAACDLAADGLALCL